MKLIVLRFNFHAIKWARQKLQLDDSALQDFTFRAVQCPRSKVRFVWILANLPKLEGKPTCSALIIYTLAGKPLSVGSMQVFILPVDGVKPELPTDQEIIYAHFCGLPSLKP